MLVSSFFYKFEIDNYDFFLKKDQTDYDIFPLTENSPGMRELLEKNQRSQKQNLQSMNPFEETIEKPTNNIWPEFNKSGQIVNKTNIQTTFDKKQEILKQKPIAVETNFLDFSTKKEKNLNFANVFSTEKQNVPFSEKVQSISEKKTFQESANIDDLFGIKPPQKQNTDLLDFTKPENINFSTNPFDDIQVAPQKQEWRSFKDFKSNDILQLNPFEEKKKFKIFDNSTQNPTPTQKAINPFDSPDIPQNLYTKNVQNPIFDDIDDSFKDAVLVPKSDNKSFETRFGNKNMNVPLETLFAEGIKDDFDIELERNKQENTKMKLHNYDIDPEEKFEEIVEGVQGWIHKTTKFFGKVEFCKKEKN